MRPFPGFSAWMALNVEAARMAWHAQNVVALRMMRLAAGGARGEAEARRMVAEKVAALIEAPAVAATTLMTGGTGHRAARKALGAYKRRVNANRRRLSK